MLSTLATAQNRPGIQTGLALLLPYLADSGYRFTTTTPLTHQRVISHRTGHPGTTTGDIFGWNLPFAPSALPEKLLDRLSASGLVVKCGGLLQATLRVSSIGHDLFVHSAYPTVQDDAVFFGPDTFRFARFIQQGIASGFSPASSPLRVLDVGCGSGAGGIVAARALLAAKSDVDQSSLDLVMNDINPLALQYTAVNAAFAGLEVSLAPGDALSAVQGEFDLIISNPPYLDDAAQRAYRHGGGRLGRALSVRITAEALGRLGAGGRLLMYTGVAITCGVDPFLAEVQPLLEAADCDWSYEEIDPDVFGEELEQPVYSRIDRIAAVGLIATPKPGIP